MKKLHVVSFNNPFPPDYGGVMDVYYKIKTLHDTGISIILHVFQYNRPPSPELLEICEAVHYYPRKTDWASHFSLIPYIVKSRESDELLENLCSDEHPVLFEGLHTCLYLNHPLLKRKQKLVRMHNIEYQYYIKLSKSALNIKSRLYFITESLKLRYFEKILKFADNILAISISDSAYCRNKYGKTLYVSAFHPNHSISSSTGTGKYILMHGNLSVEENESAMIHCIRNICKYISFPVIIAGKNPTNLLRREIVKYKNIVLVENPSESEMDKLLFEAHVHLCYTFQASGLKLKLLNSLFKGRFVVVNALMTEGSGLEELTLTGKNDKEIIDIIKQKITCEFSLEEIEFRRSILETYGNKKNALKIVKLLESAETV